MNVDIFMKINDDESLKEGTQRKRETAAVAAVRLAYSLADLCWQPCLY